jgi:hypothetical protein
LKRHQLRTLLLATVVALTTLTIGCDKNMQMNITDTTGTLITDYGKENIDQKPMDVEKQSEKEQEHQDDSDKIEKDIVGDNLYSAFRIINGERKYGYIDESGSFVIEPIYTYVKEFNDDRAIVGDKNHVKMIDPAGNILYKSEFDIESFQNGAAVITQKVNDQYLKGYIDREGNIIISPAYVWADGFQENGQAYVSPENGIFEIINKNGKVLEHYELDEEFQNIYDFDDGYILYFDPNEGHAGVVDYKGNTIIKPEYSGIEYLGNGLFAVRQLSDDLFHPEYTKPAAIVNHLGQQLSDFIHYDLSTFDGNYASATDSHYTYFINELGQRIEDLPILEGRGSLTFVGPDRIKAEIDRDLIYVDRNGVLLWKNDNTYHIAQNIDVKEVKLKPNRYVSVYYPVIEGIKDGEVQNKINDALYHIFTAHRINLVEEDYIFVEDGFTAELHGNLLIIQRIGYDYPFGAAHGMPIRETYHIDINTGVFYELRDLFATNRNYANKINQIINMQIEEMMETGDSYLFPDSFEGIRRDQDFIIREKSLIIYFTPYEIAAYAAGFPEFEISYEEIMDIIDINGAFWNSYRHEGE